MAVGGDMHRLPTPQGMHWQQQQHCIAAHPSEGLTSAQTLARGLVDLVDAPPTGTSCDQVNG